MKKKLNSEIEIANKFGKIAVRFDPSTHHKFLILRCNSPSMWETTTFTIIEFLPKIKALKLGWWKLKAYGYL